VFTPSHSLTLSYTPGVCDVTPGLPFALTPGLPLGLTPGLPLGPHPCNSLCLGHEPKARVATNNGSATKPFLFLKSPRESSS